MLKLKPSPRVIGRRLRLTVSKTRKTTCGFCWKRSPILGMKLRTTYTPPNKPSLDADSRPCAWFSTNWRNWSNTCAAEAAPSTISAPCAVCCWTNAHRSTGPRLRPKLLRKFLFQLRQFRRDHKHAIRLPRVFVVIILVVALGNIKLRCRFHHRHDRLWEFLPGRHLGNHVLRNALLLLIGVENHRT